MRDLVSDPHTAILGQPQGTILNLADARAVNAQQTLLTITHESVESSLQEARKLAMRARIVLLAADELSNTATASQLHTMQHTVGKWRRRYLETGLDRLVDELRPGTSNKLSDHDVKRVLVLTLESTPADATHWSTRSMAKRAGLSRASIHCIWQAFSLMPHRSETFKLSKGQMFRSAR